MPNYVCEWQTFTEGQRKLYSFAKGRWNNENTCRDSRQIWFVNYICTKTSQKPNRRTLISRCKSSKARKNSQRHVLELATTENIYIT